MKVIDKIIVSSTAPKDKNVLWINEHGINFPSNGKWKRSNEVLYEQLVDTNSIASNRYYTYTHNSTDPIVFRLEAIQNPTAYNEYIIELKCMTTPSSVAFIYSDSENTVPISWANDAAPSFSEGYTYLISISNGLGVFSTFPNL